MDRKTGIRKDMFMQVAKNLSHKEILALRTLSPKMSVWGFEFLAKNNQFDLTKSDDPWSLIIEEKMKVYTDS